MRRLISSGSSFEAAIGYSRAVVDGEWVFVSGTTGFDYETMSLSPDLLTQADKALYEAKERGRNRVEVAGAEPETSRRDAAAPAGASLAQSQQ